MDQHEWITVTTCELPAQADVLRVALENEGITVLLENYNTVATNWLWQNAVGGIRVNVPTDQVEKAKQFLQANPGVLRAPEYFAKDSAEKEVGETCLACGAPMSPSEDKCSQCGWTFQ